ncbi:MAG TPA: hypothetical protein VHB49_13280 [Bradyrhizobium sp.]|nr:hypothetical protein [Bradyrhizobium sp.]
MVEDSGESLAGMRRSDGFNRNCQGNSSTAWRFSFQEASLPQSAADIHGRKWFPDPAANFDPFT